MSKSKRRVITPLKSPLSDRCHFVSLTVFRKFFVSTGSIWHITAWPNSFLFTFPGTLNLSLLKFSLPLILCLNYSALLREILFFRFAFITDLIYSWSQTMVVSKQTWHPSLSLEGSGMEGMCFYFIPYGLDSHSDFY